MQRTLYIIKSVLINNSKEITAELQQCGPSLHNTDIIRECFKTMQEQFNLFISMSNQLQSFQDRRMAFHLSQRLDEGIDTVDCPDEVD